VSLRTCTVISRSGSRLLVMHDVAIVGAGPAGSVLARLLALHGVRVVLAEASSHPRRKPCGESLNPGAVEELRRLGLLSAVSSPPGVKMTGWRLHAGGTVLEASFPGNLCGWACLRSNLDERLAAEAADAGARLDERIRIEGFLGGTDGPIGVYGHSSAGTPYSLQAKIIVGADGIRSTIARSAGLSRGGKLRKAAFTVHASGIERLEPLVELHIARGVTVGVAPVGDGTANLTVALPGAAAAMASGCQEAFVIGAAKAMPGLGQRLAAAAALDGVVACGPFDRPVSAAARGNIILVGDAAGYYDPLTGQGIYRALRSAELAAVSILKALNTGSMAPLADYSRKLRREFAFGNRVQRMIEFGIGHPILFHSAIRCLVRNEKWRTRLAGVIGDCPST
jgi:flavin-dependent dehydrogenase